MLHLHDLPAVIEALTTREPDTAKVHAIISHMLRWCRSYDTPEAWADGLLERLELEGYRIVPKDFP